LKQARRLQDVTVRFVGKDLLVTGYVGKG
jgi:hypothetical protein